ncbi:MAG TPA: hypothetical protein VM597_26810 [Gemmataceae bacterium]|jgi:hypothetical protein|nr:hypothetical protein [Gemmataceae bacterium]
MGGFNTYLCHRCPLVIELGGHTAYDRRRVASDMTQVICAACGTMHQLTEERGRPCQVTALPGPVRGTRTAVVGDVAGVPFETTVWATPDEWRPIGPHPGGVKDLAGFPCSHCGRAGRMVSLATLLYPGGCTPDAERQENCPVCGEALSLLAISDTI